MQQSLIPTCDACAAHGEQVDAEVVVRYRDSAGLPVTRNWCLRCVGRLRRYGGEVEVTRYVAG